MFGGSTDELIPISKHLMKQHNAHLWCKVGSSSCLARQYSLCKKLGVRSINTQLDKSSQNTATEAVLRKTTHLCFDSF